MRRSPFGGSIQASRVPLVTLRSGRPTVPFPHPGNYKRPLEILEAFFWGAEQETGGGRHNRYLDVPGFAPVLVTRDPGLIRAISAETGEKPGQFDRDTMPSRGIARATGVDSLLYANGPGWKRQKKIATPPFARTTLFQPERFNEFEQTFRATVRERLAVVATKAEQSGGVVRVCLEPEIKAIMLEMLVNNFFGASVPHDRVRDRFVPALEQVIDHIVTETVMSKFAVPLRLAPRWIPAIGAAKRARAVFEELTDLALEPRHRCTGLWNQFESDAPDEALRSNIRVFLAGALEATTSYAGWAISHLARDEALQERVYAEVRDISEYTPENLARAALLGRVLNETLRLTPSLYFHPRRATADTTVDAGDGRTLSIPVGTHILLDVWHANRHEDHWGVAATGSPADRFDADRWARLEAEGRDGGRLLHFGFGHGPRFCPGKSLGQLEVALVVGAMVKLFRFRAVNAENPARAGVSTKPQDGVLVDLWLRSPPRQEAEIRREGEAAAVPRCPFRPTAS